MSVAVPILSPLPFRCIAMSRVLPPATGAFADAASDMPGLMARAQEGDAAAYATLLRDCIPLIRRIGRAAGSPPGLLDDVVQDVLLTIHRVRHTYDPSRPFTPWLRAIVQRRLIDVLRRTTRQAVRERHEPIAYEAHPDPDPGPAEAAQRRGRAAVLAEAVQRLPPGQREALEHLGLQERSLAETSALTGRSVGALKVNLHRALKSLRTLLHGSDI